MTDRRRALPSVDRLLQEPGVRALCDLAPRNVVAGAVRDAIARARTRRAGIPDDWTAEVADLVRQRLRPSLAPVLNATGIVLHTNLGRAPLAAAAVTALAAVASGYSTLAPANSTTFFHFAVSDSTILPKSSGCLLYTSDAADE